MVAILLSNGIATIRKEAESIDEHVDRHDEAIKKIKHKKEFWESVNN